MHNASLTLPSVQPLPDFDIESFIFHSEKNKLIQFLSHQIAEEKSVLFYGPNQSGKTHVLHAIAHILKKQNKGFLLTTPSLLLQSLIAHAQQNEVLTFRNKVHHQHIILLDDIHNLKISLALQQSLSFALPPNTVIIATSNQRSLDHLHLPLASRFTQSTWINLTPMQAQHTENILHAYAQSADTTLSSEEIALLSINTKDLHTQKALIGFKARRNLSALTPKIVSTLTQRQINGTKYSLKAITNAIIQTTPLTADQLRATNPLAQHRHFQDLAIFLCRQNGSSLAHTAAFFQKKHYKAIHQACLRAKLYLEKPQSFQTIYAIEKQLKNTSST